MACYEYHFITFPFSRKNKNSGGQVSYRSAAVLATSVLHDLGLVSPIDRSKVIDRSKIRRERRKNRKWLVCLVHANDLPLRHLFEALDGATTGPRGFPGSIGKRLVTCSEQPVSS